ncbi:high-affinity branched-chain amino acid transport system permease protein LivH [bacterium BMS3Abin02]|nr:high-affinity branched-chain amino acid transport system permease protein LivH [bacterium BMS3Abin02]GBE22893.1 high-affinity branched-chain amino acid transport system permease protein LivH [bacterium BMS3Bbin01]HDH25762.1 branched-chain amino acid ABC transporter permease [Actinomycetota bacterium]HDL49136.1 branched-chain amino acid ABC transporter permease [Actinomycetota bacterium]
MSLEVLVQQLLNALSLGSIYALLALGLAVVYSVLGLLNFAYGELITVNGYMMFVLIGAGMGFWEAALLGVVAAVAASLLIERTAFRPLRGASATTVIFSSFAVSVIIQNLIRNLVSPRPKGIAIPSWMDGVVAVGPFRLPVLSLITVAVALVGGVILTAMLTRSRHGLAMRAAAEDFTTARLMGVRAGRMIILAFGVSGLLAGIAGFLWVARRGAVTPTMGFTPLLEAFIAVVLGGFGKLSGAVYGGFLLAFIEVALQAALPAPLRPFTSALTLVVVVVILFVRPQGLAKAVEGRVA